jgi:hypothetical protein
MSLQVRSTIGSPTAIMNASLTCRDVQNELHRYASTEDVDF